MSTVTNRNRHITLVIFGIIAVFAFWYVAIRDDDGINDNYDGKIPDTDLYEFDAVTSEEEEDFVTSTRSAINTIKLPYNVNNMEQPKYDKNKPNLILHVGPAKTGLLNLHKDIKSIPIWKESLKDDGYIFTTSSTKKYDTTALYQTCQEELSLIRKDYNEKKRSNKSLNDVLSNVKCWKQFLDILDTIKTENTDSSKPISFIISDETLSKQFITNVYNVGPAVLDWPSIQETVLPTWNVIVIINYRRYFEWIVSAKMLAEQYHLQQHSASPPRLARWPNKKENGMLLEPLFPHFIENTLSKLDVPYTTRLIELYQPFVSQIHILNIHTPTQQSVRTTLFCNILEHATTACERSKNDDKENFLILNNTTIINDPSRAILELDDDIVWSNFQLFDELTCTAMIRGFVRPKMISRTLATKTTEYYVEKYLNIHPRHDLPLHCPNEIELNKFFDESVQYEQIIFNNDNINKESHQIAFNEYVNEKLLCSINMRAVLRKQDWRNFFRHLTKLSATKIQAGGKPGVPGHLSRLFLRG